MGWNSYGPGGAEYRYGDIVETETETEAGTLSYVPWLSGPDDAFERVEFEHIQQLAINLELPWTPLPFAEFFGHTGIEFTLSGEEHLDELEAHLTRHADTLRAVLENAYGVLDPLDRVFLDLGILWHVPAHEIDALFSWFEAWGPLEAPLPRAPLAHGIIDVWYRPPADLEATFDALSVDPTAHFLAHMLGAHAVSGDDFLLEQPGDEYQREVSLG